MAAGAEVAAPGADVGEAEQQQADEDVRSVQAGEAVEDRAEGAVAGAEADVDVLVDLHEEERRAEQPGDRQAQPSSRCGCPCGRPRAPSGSLNEEVIRIAVLTPATSVGSSNAVGRPAAGRVGDLAEEEVGGEEGPEQHRLGDDEEQDAERLAVDPRRLVRLGRAVVSRGRVRTPSGDRCGLHQDALPPRPRPRRRPACGDRAPAADSKCSTGSSVISLTRSMQAVGEPLRVAAGEGRDEDVVDAVVLDRVLGPRRRAPGRPSAARSRRPPRGRAPPGSMPAGRRPPRGRSSPEAGEMKV